MAKHPWIMHVPRHCIVVCCSILVSVLLCLAVLRCVLRCAMLFRCTLLSNSVCLGFTVLCAAPLWSLCSSALLLCALRCEALLHCVPMSALCAWVLRCSVVLSSSLCAPLPCWVALRCPISQCASVTSVCLGVAVLCAALLWSLCSFALVRGAGLLRAFVGWVCLGLRCSMPLRFGLCAPLP